MTPYNKSKSNYMNAAAYFRLISTECKIDIESYVTASDPVRESKALYYSLIVTLMCLGHLYATIQIIKNISQNEYDGGRYSLITLCLFTIWDVFLCLFHLYNALTTEVKEFVIIINNYKGLLPLLHHTRILVFYPLFNFRDQDDSNCLENKILQFIYSNFKS